MFKKILCFALAAFMLCGMSFTVSAADEGRVVYENDFSDPATLADFKQLRSVWEIDDGKLYITGIADDVTDTDSFGFILLNKDVTWKNYVVEADLENVQTSTGIICRANAAIADAQTANSFTGYLGFLSNNTKSGAMGRSSASDYTQWGGNYTGSVIAAGTDVGCSVHMKLTVIDDTFSLEIFDLDTGAELYNNFIVTDEWTSGTVGFRARFNFTSAGTSSLNIVTFDNLKVTCFDPVEETVTTEAPATEAPATEAPATDAPATEAPAVDTTATPATPEDTPATGDASVMVVFAAAAVLCVGAVVLIKKKEN